MKKAQKLFIYTSLLFSFLHYSSFLKGQRQVLIKSIVYDVPIAETDSIIVPDDEIANWAKNKLEPSKRCFLQQNILKKAMNGEIEVYDPSGTKLAKAEVDKIITKRETRVFYQTDPPYDSYDTILDIKVPAYRIKYLRFRESWYYDSKSFKITKEIKEYAPLIENVFENNSGKAEKLSPLFWIKCGTPPSKTNEFVLFTDFITYRCFFLLSDKIPFPIFKNCVNISDDTLNRLNYSTSLLNSISKGDIKISDSYSFEHYYQYDTHIVEEIKPTDIEETLIHVTNKKHLKITEHDIIGMHFIEKWYINKQTLEIQKEVVAMRPTVPFYSKSKFAAIFDQFELLFVKPFRCF